MNWKFIKRRPGIDKQISHKMEANKYMVKQEKIFNICHRTRQQSEKVMIILLIVFASHCCYGDTNSSVSSKGIESKFEVDKALSVHNAFNLPADKNNTETSEQDKNRNLEER